MVADVARLSGQEFSGRQTGTEDDLHSAAFVAERFASLGLQPAGDLPLTGSQPGLLWVQAQTVAARSIQAPAILEWTSHSATASARLGPDFLPILDAPSAQIAAPLVFVGYGIADPGHDFDNYAGLDVRGRVALFLRGKPESYAFPVTHADKERAARAHGAVATLTATGPVLSAYEARRGIGGAPMAFVNQPHDSEALPGAWISTELAEQLLAADGRSLREAQEQASRPGPAPSVSTNILLRLAWESRQASGSLNNVIGAVNGQDPALREHTLVIGAHRDHFGRQAGLLFPGADDNASGTAVLLAVARAFAEAGVAPKRTVLFVSFSGEEQGLLGSRLYVSRPPVPLSRTIAMLNVDHAGIGNGRLTVGLTGLAKETAMEAGRASGLADRLDLYGFFPGGDHVPFKEAGVPTVTIVSAGPHPHFHQPSDTAETVKPEILEAAARYLFTLAWQLANAE